MFYPHLAIWSEAMPRVPQILSLETPGPPVLPVHQPREPGLSALALLLSLPAPWEAHYVETHGILADMKNKEAFPR